MARQGDAIYETFPAVKDGGMLIHLGTKFAEHTFLINDVGSISRIGSIIEVRMKNKTVLTVSCESPTIAGVLFQSLHSSFQNRFEEALLAKNNEEEETKTTKQKKRKVHEKEKEPPPIVRVEARNPYVAGYETPEWPECYEHLRKCNAAGVRDSQK